MKRLLVIALADLGVIVAIALAINALIIAAGWIAPAFHR